MKIGILGGTFDPLHYGHVEMINRSLKVVDKVLIVPAGNPYLKHGVTPFNIRLEMLRKFLAYYTEVNVEISLVDSDTKMPTYTYQTIKKIQEEYPEDEIYFICGEDVLHNIETWKNYNEILNSAILLVCSRGADDVEGLAMQFEFNHDNARIEVIKDMPENFLYLSSTYIKENRAFDLVPNTIRTYIEEHRLYK